jgi:hypothetical protein
MELDKILSLLYIKGFFDNQPVFFNDFFQYIGIEVSISDSSIKNLFAGINVPLFYKNLKEYTHEIEPDNISKAIEKFYNKTPNSNYYKKYIGKTYKDILFENAKKKLPDITAENMSIIIATELNYCLNTQINAIEKKNDRNTSIVNLPDNTKNELKGLFVDLLSNLNDIISEACIYQYYLTLAPGYSDTNKVAESFCNLKSKYNHFDELVIRLITYKEIYPNITILFELFDQCSKLSLAHFTDPDYYNSEIQSKEITETKNKLTEINRYKF